MADENLILYFVPSLVAILLNREKSKGSPLTEQEVIEIRDSAAVIALKPETAALAEQERGYKDIDAENVWEEWQKARLPLVPKLGTPLSPQLRCHSSSVLFPALCETPPQFR